MIWIRINLLWSMEVCRSIVGDTKGLPRLKCT